ncbi:restriction endonuclease subunit S [Rhodovulum marinum]|uniref:Type I restriction enzyme S subunit n=1 Tax=Rhodovulum marinum TaxID=320662 RepID=A0A4R2PX21_9RHOB|nr:restriction endonuclease subunit S [Rhodovulum marinum]TCP38815.1 type I restriction enzyme S subunit [Rhodovulum marinum]
MPARYKTMVDTGNSFLGKMPSHWTVNRGAAFLYEKKVRNVGTASTNYLSLMANRGIILYEDKGDVGNKKPEDLSKCKVVEIGDFVLNSMNYAIGSYGISPYNGVCSPVYVIMRNRPETAEHAFVNYILSNRHYQTYAQSFGTGILDHRRAIGWEEIKQIPVALPPLEEQAAIARFLDQETGQIDGLIEKKTRFIALLKEKILGFSDSCVTGRDDSRRVLKDVDIPWAPRIPEGWTVRKGKHLFEEMARPVGPNDEIITAFRDGQVCLRSKRRTEGYTFAEKEVGYQRILKGDLVIHTMDAFAGAIGVSEDDGKATGEYAVCKPRSDEAVPEYYAYLLRCMARRNYIYVLCPSVRERAPRFRFVRFAPVKLPVPPREEQLEIVDRIERATARMKNLIALTERSIDLLREKRAALITAAVTGKIDVRAAA